MKNILIIGAQGKLGASLTKKYTENFRVIPLESQDYYREDNINFIDYILNKLKNKISYKLLIEGIFYLIKNCMFNKFFYIYERRH
jgi:dTDP-4-dehydrorhamnose reductase